MITTKGKMLRLDQFVATYMKVANDKTFSLLERARANVEACRYQLQASLLLVELLEQLPGPEDVKEIEIEPEEEEEEEEDV